MRKTQKKANSCPFPKRSGRAAFTFVELVVAMVIGATVIMVAVLAYGAIARNGPSRLQTNVTIGTNAIPLYGTNIALIAVSEAPSFAAAAMAESMRERLLSDIASASAVCCLSRNKPNIAGRPTNLALPTNFDVRRMVTPDSFRTNLIEPTTNVYLPYTGASTNANLSIYILGYSGASTNVLVKAIYETDFVNLTNSPVGVYASVRRWVGLTLTDYYHVFYPAPPANSSQRTKISPLAVFFDQAPLGANTNFPYRQAAGRPFYFVWWPDPARKYLASTYTSESGSTTNTRAAYVDMAGATSFFFVIPVFPPL